MSLSEQELRALQEIEQSLLADDPKFGASVIDGVAFSRGSGSLTLRGVALVLVGLVVLVGGAALTQQSLWFVVLSIAGFLVMFGAGVWMLCGKSGNATALLAGGGAERQGRLSGRNAARVRGGRSPRSSRLEDNFRRRFEGHDS